MENIAWYRKYRPSTIEDYIGDDIRRIVNSRFTDKDKLPQVALVYGTRGCGKTTFARIISKYYLCESSEDGHPCEQCEICRTINDVLIAGEIGVEVPGVVEIDATIANGKDAIQDIIEDAILEPMYTRYKVLIVDEAHMITPQAQNSLLKVIEDIPKHLVVIFATTDPEKVLGTIKSRCQVRLNVRKKTVDEMADRLLYISKKEGLTTSLEALRIIAKKADRVPRESINLLESIAKTYGNVVTIENVRESTGDVAVEIYMDYFKAANESLEDILNFNQRIKELDIAPKDFISGLTRFVIDCMYIRHGIQLDDYPKEFVKKAKDLFKMYTSNEFDTLLQVIEHASKMIVTDDDARNELVIINTALRIGKIGLLAEGGLSDEVSQADKENKKSIREYKANIERERRALEDRVTSFEPTKEKVAEHLRDMADIIDVKEIEVVENKDTEEVEDGYFSTNELESLMENIDSK